MEGCPTSCSSLCLFLRQLQRYLLHFTGNRKEFAKTTGQGGEGDEDGEGHGVQKPGGCEGKNLACRERGEVKEVFVNVVNEKEELVSKVHGSCRQARGAGKKAFGGLQ